ncbi:MAG TPA: TetR/AcrR family transcriptional regulator [Sphingobium sp.]
MDAVRSVRGGSRETQRERAVETRAALVAAARSIFTETGFHAARAIDIVKAASLTRGALYHHFADKEALFEQVFREVAQELNRRTALAVVPLRGDLWAQVREAFRTYLELVASTGEFQRILLIDGPAVLGWQRWRAIQSDYVATGTAEALTKLMKEGLVAHRPAQPLANLIQATLNDVALSIAHPSDGFDGAESLDAFFFFLDRIRG